MDDLSIADKSYEIRLENNQDFDFENEQVASAFSKLSPAQSQPLIMLFVQEQTSQEVADKLGCSVQHIYNQRSLALKKLKLTLCKGK